MKKLFAGLAALAFMGGCAGPQTADDAPASTPPAPQAESAAGAGATPIVPGAGGLTPVTGAGVEGGGSGIGATMKQQAQRAAASGPSSQDPAGDGN